MKVLLKAQRPTDKNILFNFRQFSNPENLRKIIKRKEGKNRASVLLLNSLVITEISRNEKCSAEAEADLIIGKTYSTRRLA